MRAPLVVTIALPLLGCGGARHPAPAADRDPAPEPAADTPCGAMFAHLDGVLGADFTVRLDDEPVTRAALAMRCAGLTSWSVACLTLSADATQAEACGPGSTPTLLSYAGPSAYQNQKFEECVEAATTRDELFTCSYYKPGPGREPLYPDEP